MAALLGAAVALAGCATFGPAALPPGASMDEARTRLGPPTGTFPLGDGTRLEYATGPFGHTTWMLDFDADGRLRAREQVLTEKRFHTITPGMSADVVRLTLGRPSEVTRLAFQSRDLWSYRFDGPFCLLFNVGIADDRTVVDTGFGPDPRCEIWDPSPR